MADSNSKLDHLLGNVVENLHTNSSDLLARLVPGQRIPLSHTVLSSGLLRVGRHLILSHTRRLEAADRDAQRRAAKHKERDNEAKAKREAVNRHGEKACLCLFMLVNLCLPELAYDIARL